MSELIQLRLPTNENEGLELISLVENPAHQRQWLTFGASQKVIFATANDKQWVTGVAMMPDTPIYRNSGGAEWYCIFSKNDILEMMQRFMLQNRGAKANINHAIPTNNAYLIESYITDASRKQSAPEHFGALPDGTWIVTYKITDVKLWQQIKTGKLNGFSVEGLFETREVGDYSDEIIKQLNQALTTN